MTRSELMARLKDLQPWLTARGVERTRVFGSHARDQAGPDSDIDLLIDFAPGKTPDLFKFAGLKLDLEAMLGTSVDLFTPASLHPRLRSSIEAALIDA